jgi:hypothetical protein
MAITYEPIATTTLGTLAEQLHFLLLAGTYTDLVLYLYDESECILHIYRFNTDTGSNYSANILMDRLLRVRFKY